jgi:hypothetical protein
MEAAAPGIGRSAELSRALDISMGFCHTRASYLTGEDWLWMIVLLRSVNESI